MTRGHKILYWSPRVLAIVFILFISLFALDVFADGFSWLGLLIHLLPNLILVAALVLAWRHEYLGGIIFIVLGAAYGLLVWHSFLWLTVLVISGPAVVIGVLFLANQIVLKSQAK